MASNLNSIFSKCSFFIHEVGKCSDCIFTFLSRFRCVCVDIASATGKMRVESSSIIVYDINTILSEFIEKELHASRTGSEEGLRR